MLIKTRITVTLVSLTTTLVGCGGVDTTNPGTTGAGGAGSTTSSSSGIGGSSTGTGLECMSPQVACGGSCIDTSGDAANCGSCGHSCQGGACVVSRCQPVIIATGQYAAGHIAANSSGVYWSMQPNKLNDETSVMMFPTPNGPLISLALGLKSLLVALTVDAKNVYWIEGYNVATVPVGGGLVTTLAVAGMNGVTGLAVDGTSVYWAEQYVALNKTPLGGGSAVQLASVPSDTTFFLGVSANSVFWVGTGTKLINMVPKAGGPVTPFVSGVGAGELVVDEKNVYWADGLSNMIRAVPLGGGSPTTLSAVPCSPRGLAQDEMNLYVSCLDANGAIFKIAKSGGTPEILASAEGFVQSVAVDATSVYWARNDGSVVKVAK
jgi:hypothetical protein